MLTKGDKWLVIALLIFALAGVGLNMHYIAANGQGQSVVITVNGQTVKTFPLRQGYVGEFRLGGDSGFNIIEYNDGRVRIREADCPDQICVKTGWINISPQQIVCLPYRVVVKVVSDSPADVDDIAR
ncbi:NusG domain II-containing protein [Sporomusa sp.]|uniref:NusG domain II-containing protein n=1 Tax=Sporomusa sp. TaxID=2078658 RepID=UPI002D08DAA5|nr:NusG domain II-containing protein [Sporomusa sp.]HWR44643.1 NusG domain II-containing protein [Sporomusa sp.]